MLAKQVSACLRFQQRSCSNSSVPSPFPFNFRPARRQRLEQARLNNDDGHNDHGDNFDHSGDANNYNATSWRAFDDKFGHPPPERAYGRGMAARKELALAATEEDGE